MKKSLLILSLMLTSSIYSQVISVNITKTYSFQKHGKLSYLEILKGQDTTKEEAIQARRAAEDKYRKVRVRKVKVKTATQTELRAAADYEAFVYLWYDSNNRKYYLDRIQVVQKSYMLILVKPGSHLP